MMDSLQHQLSRDSEKPAELRDDLKLVGVKYRKFREVSRRMVVEAKDTAEYFERWLKQVAEEARGGEARRLVKIGRICDGLADKLEPLQERLEDCVAAYGATQSEVQALASRARSLQETSDTRAGVFMGLTACAAIVAPVALIAEERLIALAAGSAGLAGRNLAQDYSRLSRFYAQFCLKMRDVATKVQAERDELKTVRASIGTASMELLAVEGELNDTALDDLIAEGADEAAAAFGAVAKRCDSYLERSRAAPGEGARNTSRPRLLRA